MATLEDRLKRKLEEAAQLQKKVDAKKQRERSAEEKKNTRRAIMVGGAVIKCFPELRQLDPKGKKNFPEIERLAEYLSKSAEFMRLLDLAKNETNWPD